MRSSAASSSGWPPITWRAPCPTTTSSSSRSISRCATGAASTCTRSRRRPPWSPRRPRPGRPTRACTRSSAPSAPTREETHRDDRLHVPVRGGVGPFSRFAWPQPRGEAPAPWVVAPGGAAIGRSAVHGCRVHDLPWWLQDELWEAEFDGEPTAGRHKIMAPLARLLRRIDAWDGACAQRFADACARRARDHAATALDRPGAGDAAAALRDRAGTRDIPDAVRAFEPPEPARVAVMMGGDAARRPLAGAAVVTAYIAAHAAAAIDREDGMAAERACQSEWLRAELQLGH